MAEIFEKKNLQYLEFNNKISQISTISIWTSTVQWNKEPFSTRNPRHLSPSPTSMNTWPPVELEALLKTLISQGKQYFTSQVVNALYQMDRIKYKQVGDRRIQLKKIYEKVTFQGRSRMTEFVIKPPHDIEQLPIYSYRIDYTHVSIKMAAYHGSIPLMIPWYNQIAALSMKNWKSRQFMKDRQLI